LFAGKWGELESIMLSEIRLRKTNITCVLSCVEFISKNEQQECKTGGLLGVGTRESGREKRMKGG
jgi:hypothetical protein